MAALLKSLFFVFNISFLCNYRIKYYDYCKMVEWDIMQLLCIDGYFLHFSWIGFAQLACQLSRPTVNIIFTSIDLQCLAIADH